MIRKIHDKVYTALRDSHAARNNDKYLMLDIWESEGLFLTPEQERKFMRVSSAESITRARRKIQESGEFLADKSVQLKRAELADQVAGEAVAPKVEARAVSWLKD